MNTLGLRIGFGCFVSPAILFHVISFVDNIQGYVE